MLIRVEQPEPWGCGAACVAMLAGTSYERAAGFLFGKEEAFGVDHQEMIGALLHFGLEPRRRAISFRGRRPSFGFLNRHALLKVNPRNWGQDWHWVVWDAEACAILDPKRPPYKRLRYVSYLLIDEGE